MKVWYRVFCVRKSEDGYKVLNASATKGIEVPEEPTPPDPVTLGLEASLADGGKVLLDWSACNVDGFAFYKVLRSTTNENPSYLPCHDGTEVVGVVSEQGATSLEVWAPDAGATAWYRVQCIGYLGDQKVLLGESAVVAVTDAVASEPVDGMGGWAVPVSHAAVPLGDGRMTRPPVRSVRRWRSMHEPRAWSPPGSRSSWPMPGRIPPRSASCTTTTCRGSTPTSRGASRTGRWPRT